LVPVRRPFAIAIISVAALTQVAASAGDPRPQVSFRHDIVPVLTTSCSTRSCHGGMRPPLLGAHDDPKELRAALVGAASDERPGMKFVQPNDSAHSYLVEKIAGQMIDRNCTDHDCGDAMPLDNPALAPEIQQTIRTWIDQGARDN
jgi:hypothetical protein